MLEILSDSIESLEADLAEARGAPSSDGVVALVAALEAERRALAELVLATLRWAETATPETEAAWGAAMTAWGRTVSGVWRVRLHHSDALEAAGLRGHGEHPAWDAVVAHQPGMPEADRLTLLRRLRERLGAPTHPHDRRRVAAAAGSRRRLESEALGALVGALPEVVKQGGPRTDEEALEELRRLVRGAVPEAVLGPGWWRGVRGREGPLGEREPEAPEQPDPAAGTDLLRRLEAAGLSARERTLVDAIARGAETLSEAAQELGVKPSTARNLAARIRRKISPGV